MSIQHISKLSADDFQAVVGQTFQVPTEDGVRLWTLRDVETHALILAPEPRCCGEDEDLSPKSKLDKRTQARLAKAAVSEINANLDALGYTGPKVDKPVNTVTLGFEGETGNEPLPEGDYSLFHVGLGTIEGVLVNHTINAVPIASGSADMTPLYDVTYTVA